MELFKVKFKDVRDGNHYDLFANLGFDHRLTTLSDYIFGNLKEMQLYNHVINPNEYHMVTIENLKDMVVLKRNDPNDANYIRHRDGKLYFVNSSKTRSYYMLDDEWTLTKWDEDQLHAQLKPIKEEVMKEYLEKQGDGSYKLVMRGDAIKADDIKVPENSYFATKVEGRILFWIGKDSTICAEAGKKFGNGVYTMNECVDHYDHEVIWQRGTLNDQVKTAEGLKFDNYKPRHSLLPKGAVNSVIKVLEFGTKKYDADNWQKVDNAEERYYNAAMRHIDSWWNGEKRDPETGIHHLAHAATNLFFLMWFDGEQNGK